MWIVAEAFGALALIINFIGYRQSNINHYRIVSAFAMISLGLHFFMLDAMAAGVGCMLASIRNFVALRYRSALIVMLFVAINIGFFAYEWFWLQHGTIILIAYSSSLIFTVGSIVIQDAMKMRQRFVFAELLGLLYAIAVGSIFGSIFNFTNLVSILHKLHKERRATTVTEC